jgi:hypothetical protein
VCPRTHAVVSAIDASLAPEGSAWLAVENRRDSQPERERLLAVLAERDFIAQEVALPAGLGPEPCTSTVAVYRCVRRGSAAAAAATTAGGDGGGGGEKPAGAEPEAEPQPEPEPEPEPEPADAEKEAEASRQTRFVRLDCGRWTDTLAAEQPTAAAAPAPAAAAVEEPEADDVDLLHDLD